MITPPIGGLNVYTGKLVKQLRSLGVAVDTAGSTQKDFPFDKKKMSWRTSKWLQNRLDKAIKKINFNNYDLIGFHYGKNDVEQYFPLKIDLLPKVKKVYFVHYLSRNLFEQYLNDTKTNEKIEKAVYEFYDGYIFYGKFAKKFMQRKTKKKITGIISYYPEAHSSHQISKKYELKFDKSFTFPHPNLPTVYILGYGSDYKDCKTLINSLKYVSRPFRLIFAGRGWQKRIGFIKKKISKTYIYSVEREINEVEFKYLCNKSLFGILPYRQPIKSTEVFQGSGVLPNFIYSGKATIVFDEGCMAEYVGNSGIIIKRINAKSLGLAIEKMLNDKHRLHYEMNAKKRAKLFSVNAHVKKCLRYFNKLVKEK